MCIARRQGVCLEFIASFHKERPNRDFTEPPPKALTCRGGRPGLPPHCPKTGPSNANRAGLWGSLLLQCLGKEMAGSRINEALHPWNKEVQQGHKVYMYMNEKLLEFPSDLQL